MAKTSNKPAPVPAPEAGGLREQLRQPEVVADLSHPEVTEIKERRRLIEKHAEYVTDQQKILRLLQSEQTSFLQRVVTSKGLSLNDEYNLDTDAGVIIRTAKAVVAPEPVELPTEAEPELAAVEG